MRGQRVRGGVRGVGVKEIQSEGLVSRGRSEVLDVEERELEVMGCEVRKRNFMFRLFCFVVVFGKGNGGIGESSLQHAVLCLRLFHLDERSRCAGFISIWSTDLFIEMEKRALI